MGLKTSGVGHFTIPTAPAAGTSVTSGAANVFTTTYVQLIASTAASLYITGIHVEKAAASAATYCIIQLATGAAAAETIIGQYLVPLSTGSTVALGYRQIYPPIAVATSTRISCKSADSVGAQAALVTLECIAQAGVVDDGVAVGSVTGSVGSVVGLTASNLDAAISSRMATYTQPTGFLAASFPTTVASPTNITAGVITTVTNLTNAPTAGDLTATMKTSVTAAATAATPTAAAVTGAVGSVTGAVGSVTGAVGSVTGAVGSVTGNVGGNVVGSVASVTAAVTLPTIPTNWISAAGIAASALNGKGDWLLSSGYTAPLTAATTRTALGMASANLDTQLGTLLPTASYVAPDNASVAAIKLKTDSLTFTVAGKLDVGVYYVNGIAVTGLGTAASPWRAV